MTSITYIISLVLLLMRGYQTHQEAHIYMAARHGDSIMALAGSCSLHWSGQEKKNVLLGRTEKKTGQERGCCRQAPSGPKAAAKGDAADLQPEGAGCTYYPTKGGTRKQPNKQTQPNKAPNKTHKTG